MMERFGTKERAIASVSLATALAFGAAACESDPAPDEAPTATETQSAIAGEYCDVEFSQQLANSQFATERGFLPEVSVEDAEQATEAVEAYKEQIGGDARVASIFTAINELADGRRPLSEFGPSNIEDVMNSFRSLNDETLGNTIDATCANLNEWNYDSANAIIGGEATEIRVQRDDNGEVNGIVFAEIDQNQTFEALTYSANLEDNTLDAEDVAYITDLGTKLSANLEAGTLVIEGVALNGAIEFESDENVGGGASETDTENEASAEPTPEEEADNQAPAQPSEQPTGTSPQPQPTGANNPTPQETASGGGNDTDGETDGGGGESEPADEGEDSGSSQDGDDSGPSHGQPGDGEGTPTGGESEPGPGPDEGTSTPTESESPSPSPTPTSSPSPSPTPTSSPSPSPSPTPTESETPTKDPDPGCPPGAPC